MARAPLLQLSSISLGHGSVPLFHDLDAVVHQGDRVALVGRNGSGKSTLLKVMAGLVEPDDGVVATAPGTTVGYLEQDPDVSAHATLGDFASQGLDPSEAWRVEVEAEALALDPAADAATASGGERRRAALVRLMARQPDLMLLDEPTNHLDIAAIAWLERRLVAAGAGFVVISHDRAFLSTLTRATLWIDRGAVRRQEAGFAEFEGWRDKVWEEEDTARHKLDRKIRAEARWAVEGISARRKRNMGRVRALADLRAQRDAQVRRQDAADLALDAGPRSGRLVIEAEGVAKAFDGRTVVAPLSLRLERGARLAIVGPNGAGKTTLLRLLTGEVAPDTGRLRHGSNLEIAVFDQNRAALDPDATPWETLTGAEGLRVSGQADQVMVRGIARHVLGYLKDFLFDEAQARAPIRSLSGGERARLLLAQIMARQSNLLVLDEPTNDLDVETLDLLQDVLAGYDGTVLLVSHDRDFLDRVATRTAAFEGGGKVAIYAGGWTDYVAQSGGPAWMEPAASAPSGGAGRPDGTGKSTVARRSAEGASAGKRAGPAGGGRDGLSFTERHRLAALPDRIATLEREVATLQAALSDTELYRADRARFDKITAALADRTARLAAAEEDWLDLAERNEAAES